MRGQNGLLWLVLMAVSATNLGCTGTIRKIVPQRQLDQPCSLALPNNVPLPPYGQEVPFLCLHEFRDSADSTNIKVIFYYRPVEGMEYHPDKRLKFFPFKRNCIRDENLPPNTFTWLQRAGQPTDWSNMTVYFNVRVDDLGTNTILPNDPKLIHPPSKKWINSFPRVQK